MFSRLFLYVVHKNYNENANLIVMVFLFVLRNECVLDVISALVLPLMRNNFVLFIIRTKFVKVAVQDFLGGGNLNLLGA